MTNRLVDGFRIYQRGDVEILMEDEMILQFEVQSGKRHYTVDIDLEEGVARCICPDYEYRHQLANSSMGLDGSFICKHIHASLFKLAELRGVGSQTTLDTSTVKGVG